MKTYLFKKTINLVELSDVFRRHAQFTDQYTAKQLVKAARRIACLSTHYHPEYPQGGMNANVDKHLKKEIKRLADLAKTLNVKEIVLPFEYYKTNWIAHRIQDKVIDQLALPVAVKLQTNSYKKDLTDFGRIDKRIKTALDKNIRGIAAIDPDLKLKWDRKLPKRKPRI